MWTLDFLSTYTTKTFQPPSALPHQARGRLPPQPIGPPSISLRFPHPHNLTNRFKDMLAHLSRLPVIQPSPATLLWAPVNLLPTNQKLRQLGLPSLVFGLWRTYLRVLLVYQREGDVRGGKVEKTMVLRWQFNKDPFQPTADFLLPMARWLIVRLEWRIFPFAWLRLLNPSRRFLYRQHPRLTLFCKTRDHWQWAGATNRRIYQHCLFF